MPRGIQTLTFADVLARIFRLPGKAKLECDEQIIPTVGIDVTDVPFVADGRHYFAVTAASAMDIGFASQLAVVNPVAGKGIVVVDRIRVLSTNTRLIVGFGNSNFTAGSQVYSSMMPFRPGFPAPRQLPPLLRENHTAGPFGTDAASIFPWNPAVGGEYVFHADGPWVLPGALANEELIVRGAAVNKFLNATFYGRWYPGIKPSELL